MLKNSKKLNAYSLLEIMVVLVIIAVLVTLSLAGINAVRTQLRDTTRMTDAKSIRLAMENWFANNAAYPGNASVTVATAGTATTSATLNIGGATNQVRLTQPGVVTIVNATTNYCGNGTGARSTDTLWSLMYDATTTTLTVCRENGGISANLW